MKLNEPAAPPRIRGSVIAEVFASIFLLLGILFMIFSFAADSRGTGGVAGFFLATSVTLFALSFIKGLFRALEQRLIDIENVGRAASSEGAAARDGH